MQQEVSLREREFARKICSHFMSKIQKLEPQHVLSCEGKEQYEREFIHTKIRDMKRK